MKWLHIFVQLISLINMGMSNEAADKDVWNIIENDSKSWHNSSVHHPSITRRFLINVFSFTEYLSQFLNSQATGECVDNTTALAFTLSASEQLAALTKGTQVDISPFPISEFHLIRNNFRYKSSRERITISDFQKPSRINIARQMGGELGGVFAQHEVSNCGEYNNFTHACRISTKYNLEFVQELLTGVISVTNKVGEPYEEIDRQCRILTRLHDTSNILRCVIQVQQLAKIVEKHDSLKASTLIKEVGRNIFHSS